jgi:uncharacterized protein
MTGSQRARGGGGGPRRQRHVPQRTCVGCRSTAAKRGFVRVVRDAEGRVRVDPSGKANGRGAYVCASPGCWEAAVSRGKLAQSLRIALRDDDRAGLRAYAATLAPDHDSDGPPPAADPTAP